MTTFKIDCKGSYISAIYDSRYQTPVDITDGTGRFGQLVYTLSEEDITKADKPEFAPYTEHYASYSICHHIGNGILMENSSLLSVVRIVISLLGIALGAFVYSCAKLDELRSIFIVSVPLFPMMVVLNYLSDLSWIYVFRLWKPLHGI